MPSSLAAESRLADLALVLTLPRAGRRAAESVAEVAATVVVVTVVVVTVAAASAVVL